VLEFFEKRRLLFNGSEESLNHSML
jgi:hypothetical protein